MRKSPLLTDTVISGMSSFRVENLLLHSDIPLVTVFMKTSVVQSSLFESMVCALFVQRNMVSFTYRLLLHKSHKIFQQNVCVKRFSERAVIISLHRIKTDLYDGDNVLTF
jgi:hypothetical protein